jgi:hypothetical protein
MPGALGHQRQRADRPEDRQPHFLDPPVLPLQPLQPVE